MNDKEEAKAVLMNAKQLKTKQNQDKEECVHFCRHQCGKTSLAQDLERIVEEED